MEFPEEKWTLNAPGELGIDGNKLNKAVEYLKNNSGSDNIEELVICRYGKIVFAGDSVTKIHGIWSCTKSFVSTIAGILIDDGKLKLTDMASDFVPELSEKYADVTIAHFLTMTSGYTAVGDSTNGSYKHGPSSTPYLPGNPLFVPGSRYSYWDSAMNEFALVLTIAAGEPLDSFFMKRVARMIGIEDKNWWWGDFGIHNANKINSGAGNLDRNIFISATDFARFGHLFLNNGNWNGKQIISRNWVDQANSVQVPASVKQGTPLSPIDGSGIYGFNWWVNGTNADGQKNWPDAPDKTYSASGYNNNDMFVIPEWDMVVVRMGLDQQEIAISNMVYSKFLGLIGESIFKK